MASCSFWCEIKRFFVNVLKCKNIFRSIFRTIDPFFEKILYFISWFIFVSFLFFISNSASNFFLYLKKSYAKSLKCLYLRKLEPHTRTAIIMLTLEYLQSSLYTIYDDIKLTGGLGESWEK